MRKECKECIDATEELVQSVEPKHMAEVETEPIRTVGELMSVAYEDMTENERKYFISALKMRNQELDNITKSAFEQVNKQKMLRDKDLRALEDTLTFIKATVANSLGSVTLAIKNAEREVRNNGN